MQLELRHLTCLYDKTIRALDDISLSIAAGESVCVAGANGSGKSTLLKVIAAAIPYTSGELLINGEKGGEKVWGKSEKGGAPAGERRAGLVFQDPDNQLFMPTVWEDVAFGVMRRGMTAAAAKDAAMAALAAVEAADLAERAPYKLSGGEKQRAALASVLIMRPEILLLDEPSAALDPRARRKIISLLQQLPQTKIIATHDLDLALDLADRMIFLHRGHVIADCPAPGLLLDETFLRSIGLELPLTRTFHQRS